jgi:integron integrase
MCPESDPVPVPPSEPKLLDQPRGRLRVKHYSIRTEQAYVDWVRRFVLFHDKRHPRDLGQMEVEAFLTDLAVRRRVSASTQNQAKSAILFLYKEVINKELPWLNGVVAARVSQRLPVVLSVEEVNAALGRLRGTSALVARLLYGSGLRILECLRLRVKDIDFARREILVRDGKGAKDRVTMLPETLIEPLLRHLERVRELHSEDLAAGYGSVYLPYALERKYPNACREWMWQYVFPSARFVQRSALGSRQAPSCGREANTTCAAVGAACSRNP